MLQRTSMIRVAKIVGAAFAGLVLFCTVATGVGDLLIGWEYPPSGRFITTSSGRQHIVDVGPDARSASPSPAVVLLHGATANLEDMRLVLANPLRGNHRVIAVDRPGEGWSERAGGAANAAPQRQAAVLHEILGKLGVSRPVLVGHSWGGAVALAYALQYPAEVSGLVLLAPLTGPWHNELLIYPEWGNTPWIGSVLVHTVALPIGWLMLDRIAAHAFAPQDPPPNYLDRASIMLALRPSALIATAQDVARLPATTETLRPRYRQIKTPAIIMTGTADQLVSPRLNARAIAQVMPHAKLVVFPGVGHMVHHAETGRVIAAIEELARPPETRVTPATAAAPAPATARP